MRAILTAFCAVAVLTVPLLSEAHGLLQGPPQGGGSFGGGRGPGGPGGQRRGRGDDEILKSLNLTAAQQAKVKVLKEKNRAAMEKFRPKGGPGGPGGPGRGPGGPGGPGAAPAGPGGPGGRGPGGPGGGRGPWGDPKIRAAMEKQRAIYHAGLKKVLTKGQWAKYEAWYKKMEAERAARQAQGGGRGPGGPGGRPL